MDTFADQDRHDRLTINRLDEILTPARIDQVIKVAEITRLIKTRWKVSEMYGLGGNAE